MPEGIRLTESGEQAKYPRAILKLSRSGKGVLIIVPDPLTGTAHSYITSVVYLRMLLEGKLVNNMLGCNYLGETQYEQFLTKDEKQNINLLKVTTDNPLSTKAMTERSAQEVKIKDEW